MVSFGTGIGGPRAVVCAALLALYAGSALAQQTLQVERLADAREVFSGTMLPGDEVATFSHSDALFPSNVVARGGEVRRFPAAADALHEKIERLKFRGGTESSAEEFDLYDYLANDRVAGLLILKNGKLVMEDYELGTTAETRWVSFSIAKSISSTLVGAALKQGLIASLDDAVTKYAPRLKGGAYDQVSVRNLLQMDSGVKWDEGYTDPKSDRRKLLELQLEGKPGSIIDFMKALPKAGAPGTVWNYSTGESFLLGAVLEGATHKALATYLSETLWARLGMEEDATWWLESAGGMGLAGSGLAATLRDYGRFGQFVLEDGAIDAGTGADRVVPEGWFAEAGRSHEIGGKQADYGYLWWTVTGDDPIQKGAFEAEGIFGQYLYVNPAEKLVIVVLSARPKPDPPQTPVPDEAFFAAVARALH